jgi:hypothetical protein
MGMISEWIINFKQLPESSATYKAPLNISGRPLPGVELPEEYRHFQGEWIIQDLLLYLLEQVKEAAIRYDWDRDTFSLAFRRKGLRGYELIGELQLQAGALLEISKQPWYVLLCNRVIHRWRRKSNAETLPVLP